MTKPTTKLTPDQKRIIDHRFAKQMDRVKDDLQAVRNYYNSIAGSNIRIYGLPAMMGVTISGLGLTSGINAGVDYILILAWISAVVLIPKLIVDNYKLLEGPKSKIKYVAEQTSRLEDARNEGIDIDDKDVESKSEWLDYHIGQNHINMPLNHWFRTLERDLKRKIAIGTRCIIAVLIITVLNFIANLIPKLTENEIEVIQQMGRAFDLFPRWWKSIWISNPELGILIISIAPVIGIAIATILIARD